MSWKTLVVVLVILTIVQLSSAQGWGMKSESNYQNNPIVFTIDDAARAAEVRKITRTEDLTDIQNGTKIDILLFNIENGRGIEANDIIQFYTAYGTIGYTHTISSEDINNGLRAKINLQDFLIYKQVNCGDSFNSRNLNNVVNMLETMKKFWKIRSEQPFTIGTRGERVESAHNISENIECTMLSTPEATVYFKKETGTIDISEVIIPSSIVFRQRQSNLFLRFQDFSDLNSRQQSKILSEGAEVFSMGGAKADTIGIVYNEYGTAKQIRLKSNEKDFLSEKTFVIAEEKDDKGILTDDALFSIEDGVLNPNYFFNIPQYNPRKIGIKVNYDEDQMIITDIKPHENSIRNVYGVKDSTFLFWGQLKPRPKDDIGKIIKKDLTIGYDQTQDGYLLTHLGWLDAESISLYIPEGVINTTIYFQRVPSIRGYYQKIGRESFNSVIYKSGSKINRLELDEQKLSEEIAQKTQVSLHFDVVEEDYVGDRILFLNYINSSGNKIWDKPPENADAMKWKNGLLFPIGSPPVSQGKIVFEPQLTILDENGNQVDLQNSENRKWLVSKKKPQYPVLIAAGGFCYLVLASFLLL